MQGIYEIRNKLNGKRYIGSSIDIEKRWKGHKRDLKAGNHGNPHLQNAFNKYGIENFLFMELEEIKGDKSSLYKREQEYLDKWLSTGSLYNISSIAIGTCLKGELNGMYGKYHTQKTRDKMSVNKNKYYETHEGPRKGQKVTKETRAKQSKAKSGKNHPMYGKKQSQETCDKRSKALMGHEVSEKTRARQSKANSNPSDELRKKNGITNIGNEYNVKTYPAFYNESTNEFISAGHNITKLCREQNILTWPMYALVDDNTQRTKAGWRLATEKEIMINQ